MESIKNINSEIKLNPIVENENINYIDNVEQLYNFNNQNIFDDIEDFLNIELKEYEIEPEEFYIYEYQMQDKNILIFADIQELIDYITEPASYPDYNGNYPIYAREQYYFNQFNILLTANEFIQLDHQKKIIENITEYDLTNHDNDITVTLTQEDLNSILINNEELKNFYNNLDSYLDYNQEDMQQFNIKNIHNAIGDYIENTIPYSRIEEDNKYIFDNYQLQELEDFLTFDIDINIYIDEVKKGIIKYYSKCELLEHVLYYCTYLI